MIDAAGSVELAVLERSGEIESRHLGAAVLLDADGSILDSLGDPAALIYPRSAVKPLQATAVLGTGLQLDGEELVLAAASHAGTPAHVAVVERMLASAGLDESALQCPARLAARRPVPIGRRRPGGPGRGRITMNCSGKHAAFLAASVHAGWSTADYLDPAHPMQRAVATTIADYTGETVVALGHRRVQRPHAGHLASPVSRGRSAGSRRRSLPLPAAILAHPWAIDGPGRENAVTIEETGLLAKVGAEGVLVLATTARAGRRGEDPRRQRTAPRTLVGLELLVRAGLVPRERADAVIAAVVEPGLRVAF